MPSAPAPLAIDRAATPRRIADAVRTAILAGEIAPGMPLREVSLANRLGVSRHPVREAFRLLAAEGFVEHQPFRGVMVRQLTAADVADIYQVRRMIEARGIEASAVASPATLRELDPLVTGFDRAVRAEDWDAAFAIDRDFHVALVGLAGSPRLTDLAGRILLELRLAHFLSNDVDTAGFRRSRAQHREIVRLIRHGSRAAARAALLRHLGEAELPLRRALLTRATTREESDASPRTR